LIIQVEDEDSKRSGFLRRAGERRYRKIKRHCWRMGDFLTNRVGDGGPRIKWLLSTKRTFSTRTAVGREFL